MREPFPLQWPDGWARTPFDDRSVSRFVTGMARALRELLRELNLLGAANVVITSDLPRRPNGMPYGEAADAGIAVWFVLDGEERVFACDRWALAAENVHAIALSIAALRGIERWGAGDIVVRAFQGFKALPAPGATANPTARPWWVVLCVIRNPLEPPAATLAKARRAYRMLMRVAHPDAGGEHDQAAELTNAMEQARAELEEVKDGVG